ncbi:hypothetical protein OAT93_00230 [bacterium]|nr:hypothetical protein [bacterium]
MKKLIGGAIAVLFGVYGLAVFFPDILTLLAGVIPIILIIGGGLTIYLNYEKDTPDIDDSCSTSIPSTAKPQEPEPAYTAPEKDIIDKPGSSDGKLSGNTETQVFHKPDCNFAESINCTAVFNTRDDAIKEGYKPCGVCKP